MCVYVTFVVLLISIAVEADFHNPGIYGSERVWANAWDVFRRALSRGDRGRRAAVDFLVCFGCGGFFRVFRGYAFQIRRARAVSVNSVKGLRQQANLPTENSRPPIPPRCTKYYAPT